MTALNIPQVVKCECCELVAECVELHRPEEQLPFRVGDTRERFIPGPDVHATYECPDGHRFIITHEVPRAKRASRG